MLKIAGHDVAICTAILPEAALSAYTDLYERNVGRAVARKRMNEDVRKYVVRGQNAAVNGMAQERGFLVVDVADDTSGVVSSLLSDSSPMAASVKYKKVRLCEQVSHMTGQPSITTAMNHFKQTSINTSNNTRLEMAIADFLHLCNVADNAVSSPEFKHLLY